MTRPLDLGGWEILVAIAMLVGGTLALTLMLAVAARLVDRLWDAVAGDGERGDRQPARSGGGRGRVRRAALPRTIVVASLAGSLLFALAWFAFILGRARGLA